MGLLLLMGDSGFRGALDTLGTGLESAWSVGRRLRSAYSGPVIRVRRSSDNAEQDFSGSGALGAVDTAAVAAFCGAGDGFLTTIYDQSGNGRHFAQSSTTIQPVVCESGTAITEGTRLASKFVAASALRMAVASSTSIYNFLHQTGSTKTLISKSNDTAAAKIILRNFNSSAGSGIEFRRDTLERVQLICQRIGGAVPTTGASVNATSTSSSSTSHSVVAVLSDPDNATAANRYIAYQNGTLQTGANASTGEPAQENAQANLTLGATPAGLEPFDGTIQEIVIWSQIVSDANRDAYEVNAGTFYGITVA